MIDPFNRAAAQYCPNLSEILLDINHAKALPLAVPARLRPFCLASLFHSHRHVSRQSKFRDLLVSIAYTLFSIHNFAYPLYFLAAAHSLRETPGVGVSNPRYYIASHCHA